MRRILSLSNNNTLRSGVSESLITAKREVPTGKFLDQHVRGIVSPDKITNTQLMGPNTVERLIGIEDMYRDMITRGVDRVQDDQRGILEKWTHINGKVNYKLTFPPHVEQKVKQTRSHSGGSVVTGFADSLFFNFNAEGRINHLESVMIRFEKSSEDPFRSRYKGMNP